MSMNISPLKKIKIAIILPSLNIGGAEKLIYAEMAQMRNDKRFSFEIHLLFEQGVMFDAFRRLAIPLHVWNAPHKSLKLIYTFLKITAHLRQNQVDVLHCHLSNLGALFGRLAGCRVVTTLHKDVRLSLWEKMSMYLNHFMIGCSQASCRRIREVVPKKWCLLLNNAVSLPKNLKKKGYRIRQQLNLPDHTHLVVTLGRLIKAKGYDVLIEGFKSVQQHFSEVALIIAGHGPEYDTLQKQIKNTGVQNIFNRNDYGHQYAFKSMRYLCKYFAV